MWHFNWEREPEGGRTVKLTSYRKLYDDDDGDYEDDDDDDDVKDDDHDHDDDYDDKDDDDDDDDEDDDDLVTEAAVSQSPTGNTALNQLCNCHQVHCTLQCTLKCIPTMDI